MVLKSAYGVINLAISNKNSFAFGLRTKVLNKKNYGVYNLENLSKTEMRSGTEEWIFLKSIEGDSTLWHLKGHFLIF